MYLFIENNFVMKTKKILIVDDVYINRYILFLYLKEFKFIDVCFADDGKSAIKKLKEQNDIDLVFMDVRMVEMDGDEATKIIKNELNIKIPIVAVTAYDKHSYDFEVFDDIVNKPHSPRIIKDILKKYFENEEFN